MLFAVCLKVFEQQFITDTILQGNMTLDGQNVLSVPSGAIWFIEFPTHKKRLRSRKKACVHGHRWAPAHSLTALTRTDDSQMSVWRYHDSHDLVCVHMLCVVPE